MTEMQVIYVANDNYVELDGLRNSAASPITYLNGVTVTVTLLDADGAEVTGQSWPTSMGYVAASNGKYRATFEQDLAILASRRYTARVNANGGVGLVGEWDLPLRCIRRTA